MHTEVLHVTLERTLRTCMTPLALSSSPRSPPLLLPWQGAAALLWLPAAPPLASPRTPAV